jgi:hypothetical protein
MTAVVRVVAAYLLSMEIEAMQPIPISSMPNAAAQPRNVFRRIMM